MYDKRIMSTKEKYTKDFFRCCNELCLSPQSRAKIANISSQNNAYADDLLLRALRGDDELKREVE